jgi:hypothetical protein
MSYEIPSYKHKDIPYHAKRSYWPDLKRNNKEIQLFVCGKIKPRKIARLTLNGN